MEFISGGVCAAKGFTAAGIHCGIRKNKDKRDLSLIKSEVKASAAAMYTKNLVFGAPITVTREHLADGFAQAVICNSGNANTCNANGVEIAKEMCRLVEQHGGVAAEDVIVASTGVIGKPLDVSPIAAGMAELVSSLGDHSQEAAEGIMTTDTKLKEFAVAFTAGGKTCRLGGIAKGSGMIHPNMATMLVLLTTDAAIAPDMLKLALHDAVEDTFHMVSVDGDTSTNDMVSILANGMAGNTPITTQNADYQAFYAGLFAILEQLSRAIAKDGEGATKLLTCKVTGAADKKTARTVAKAVVCSTLFKAAMFGADANWGRVLCAIGYSGAEVNVHSIGMTFASKAGTLPVCVNGAGIPFSEEEAKVILSEDEIEILVALHGGEAAATAWGCDLTYDYVKINGDYRT